LADELRAHGFTNVQLKAGSGGVFDVEADGRLLFSKHREGRHAEPGEILERLRL